MQATTRHAVSEEWRASLARRITAVHALWREGVGVFPPETPLASDAGIEVLTSPRDYDKVKRDLAAAGYKGEKVVLIAADTQVEYGTTTAYGGVTALDDLETVVRLACEVDDPNDLLNCDRNYPFQTAFKMSGTVPLPYGFRVSGVFASLPGLQESRSASNVGEDFAVTYSIGRAIAPGLTQPTENVRLSRAGEYFLERSNQLDISFSRDFTINGLRVRPQVDFFNAFNSNAIIRVITAYGPALMSPREILAGRLMRLNLRIDF